jgi:hypothetical protein
MTTPADMTKRRQPGDRQMSYSRREPILRMVSILDLRPTQMTVGMIEVERKRRAWAAKREEDKSETLATHMVPVVLGPGGDRYITDHHHLTRALLEEGQKQVYVTIIGDLRKADRSYFWNLMNYHGWTHPYDTKGRRCAYEDLPKTVKDMEDDPYRSLSGALRNIGGFAKDSTAFSEFVWADFFRPRLKRKDVTRDFDAALREAYRMAKRADADFLPGWCGPHDNTAEPAPARKPRARKTED